MSADFHLARLAGDFTVPLEEAPALMARFHREMERGLAGGDGSLRMLPSFIGRPRGTERGRYLALDMGGTNIRVLEAELDGARRASLTAVRRFVIPPAVMHGPGRELFDFLAGCVAAFVAGHPPRGERNALAFTFSFPFAPLGVSAGRVIAWTKGFTAEGVIGRDVGGLLNEALARRGLGHLSVGVLINDTVGTLLAGAYARPACDLGVILGTGTNACYFEDAGRIKKLPGDRHEGEVIVNLEWGSYDGFPANRFDGKVDEASLNPGRQRMEKMVSGLYLGEIARLALREMAEEGLLAPATGKALEKPFSLSTRDLALLREGDESETAWLGPVAPPDRRVLAAVARLVLGRSARIAALAVASVLTWMDPDLSSPHAVAVDGALFAHNPSYRAEMADTLRAVGGAASDNVHLFLIQDGSGIGAAVAGAVAAGSRGDGGEV
ncbi:MAG TPA: hypothetical protein PK836_05560 [Syntrophales bacterium]|nr:hypothetical protein [Syntrophales bacterium]HOM06631.1 hypothetical protein [Syntrophales bacterium]HON99781.1 hypothetical protein [Syntrophales bacterium]HPC01135.1 hypothetical protein [Syntrophales bacterium]HPQ06292.1 hypothetical protein [Syntrophales bacterium]